MEIITRKEAVERGLTRYFTGKPCKRAHLSERMVSTMTCVGCKNKREREIYWSNPTAGAARGRRWHEENRERSRANSANYITARRKTDALFALKGRISTLIHAGLRSKGFRKTSRTAAILGCSYSEFFTHIERQFLKGMNWENRELWHIDHITPLSTAKTEAEVIALNHVTNLRPIWANDNIGKSDKILFLI